MTAEFETAPLQQLGIEVLAATLLATACVIVHGVGLAGVSRLFSPADSDDQSGQLPPVSVRPIAIVVCLVLLLILLHVVEICIFALFYLWTQALPGVEAALYYSTLSYSTVGYGDSSILPRWRLVGALESITGMILIGWSTAYFVRMLGRMDFR